MAKDGILQTTVLVNLGSSIVYVQKISILPPQKGLEFPGGWGFSKNQKVKEMCEALLEFPEGWGF